MNTKSSSGYKERTHCRGRLRKFGFFLLSTILVGLLAAPHLAQSRPLEVRAETGVAFPIDEAFLRKGGVQHFFALTDPGGLCATGDSISGGADRAAEALIALRVLDRDGIWSAMHREDLHAMISRVAYIAEVPIQFFSEARVRDVDYINSVMPGMNVECGGDGSFHAKGSLLRFMPSTRFTLDYRRGAAAARLPTPLLTGVASDISPAILLTQRNTEFGRIGGMRTSRASYAATAHYAVGTGQTLIVNCTLGYLHSLPPVGGARLIRDKARDYTAQVVANIKACSSSEEARLR